MVGSPNPYDWEEGVDLLLEATAWRIDASTLQSFSEPVLRRFEEKLTIAYQVVRGKNFDKLSPGRQEELLNQLSRLIQTGEYLLTYQPSLEEKLKRYKQGPQRSEIEAARSGPTPRRQRQAPQVDRPGDYLTLENVKPVISGNSQYSSYRYISGVSGTITNRGTRSIKDVVLSVAVQFQGFQNEFTVRVADSVIEPGETTTWRMWELRERLP